jgi:hypothetical protein
MSGVCYGQSAWYIPVFKINHNFKKEEYISKNYQEESSKEMTARFLRGIPLKRDIFNCGNIEIGNTITSQNKIDNVPVDSAQQFNQELSPNKIATPEPNTLREPALVDDVYNNSESKQQLKADEIQIIEKLKELKSYVEVDHVDWGVCINSLQKAQSNYDALFSSTSFTKEDEEELREELEYQKGELSRLENAYNKSKKALEDFKKITLY